MRTLLIYLIIILFSHQCFASAKSINIKTKFNKINCDLDKLNLNDYFDCVDEEKLRSTKAWKNKKKTNEMIYLVSILSTVIQSHNEGFITEKRAKSIWKKILSNDYKSRFKDQKKIYDIASDIKCLVKDMKFEDFISCYYNEFRSMEIYQKSDIVTKYRMENIASNALFLTKKGSTIVSSTEDIDEDFKGFVFVEGQGYEFFDELMSKFGTNFFKDINSKNYEYDVKKILLFIVATIIIAYFAKGILKSSTSGGSKVTSSATSSNPACFGGCSNVVNKPWFKYALRSGRLSYGF